MRVRATLLLALAGCATAPGAGNRGAIGGADVARRLEGLPLAERETEIWRAFTAGEMPTLLQARVPVTTTATIARVVHRATFWCAPDYFGLGRDGDWLRLPITPQLAQRLADRLDCVLPTRRMVDAIWAAAPLQLTPVPFDPKVFDICAVERFVAHHAAIERQRGAVPPATLVAGIKKDVVCSALLADWPKRVVIYGWHHPDGKPIQPLSKVHTTSHVDYSHGCRLVARRMQVDGRDTTVDAVLADPVLCALLSDEGPIAPARCVGAR